MRARAKTDDNFRNHIRSMKDEDEKMDLNQFEKEFNLRECDAPMCKGCQWFKPDEYNGGECTNPKVEYSFPVRGHNVCDDFTPNKGNIKMKKRTTIKESIGSVYDDIKKFYGPDMAVALEEFCDKFHLEPEQIVDDPNMKIHNKNAWDYFSDWAANRKVDNTLADRVQATRGYDFSGAEMRKKAEELDDEEMEDEIKPRKHGRKRKVELESYEDEGGVSQEKKLKLIELIDEYQQAMVDKAKGDRTAGMAAKIAYQKLTDLIGEL